MFLRFLPLHLYSLIVILPVIDNLLTIREIILVLINLLFTFFKGMLEADGLRTEVLLVGNQVWLHTKHLSQPHISYIVVKE